jgi:hypothetical protein
MSSSAKLKGCCMRVAISKDCARRSSRLRRFCTPGERILARLAFEGFRLVLQLVQQARLFFVRHQQSRGLFPQVARALVDERLQFHRARRRLRVRQRM